MPAGSLVPSTPLTAADPDRPDRLFATCLQARDIGSLKFTAPGNPIVVSRSDDGGATWSRPVRANDPNRGRALAPSVAVGRQGELYVLYPQRSCAV